MSLFSIKRRKIHLRRLRKIKYLNLCKLLLAAFPTILFGVFTVVFTLQQDTSAHAAREQDQRQADEINRRTIFKEYIDDITELLLDRHDDTNISKILRHIRVQTLTVLPNLDANRKRGVLVYLYENRLLRNDELPQVNLREANLNDIRFWSSSTVTCLLPSLYLPGTYLENVIFDGCDLSGAVFDEASMPAAKFRSCFMKDTRFVNTNLTRAQFRENYLSDANFSGSNLVQSSITGGSFQNIDLTNVDLYQSEVSDELLYPSKNGGKGSPTFLNTRYPNGSFSCMKTQSLLENNDAKSQCHLNVNFSRRDIFNGPSLIVTNLTQISNLDTSAIDRDCFNLTDKYAAALEKIDIRQFSLLIDLEQATFNLSAFIELKYPNNIDAISMTIQFLQGGLERDDENSLTISRKNTSFLQFEVLTASIPAKTRSLLIWLACNTVNDTDQLCVFGHAKLFIFEKTYSTSRRNQYINN